MIGPERTEQQSRAGGYHDGGAAPGGIGGGGPFVGRPELVAWKPELASLDWPAIAARFPVQVPRGWLKGAHPALLAQALPDPRELDEDPGDVADPVGDILRSPIPWVVRKHDDRVLLLLTKRCHLYCRYCFRADHRPGEADDPSDAEWAAMLAYARGSGAREVIFSGGDPLAIRDERLFSAIDSVRPEVPVVRIHTRAPITWPSRVTPALVDGLRVRAPVWVFVHCNHPAELTAPVRAALGMLVDAGIPVLNQSVLLRGVNDDDAVLAELFEDLVRLRVYPYYLHHPDAVPGNAHFRVPETEGLEIYRRLTRRLSGLALPRYVVDPPDGTGKRDVGS